MKPESPSERGMTVTELVIASAILTAVAALVWGTVMAQHRTFSRESGRSMRGSDVRVWLDRMVRDIRLAGCDPTRANVPTDSPRVFGIQVATPTTFTFTVNVDNDSVVDSGPNENRGYRWNAGALEQWQGGSSWRPVIDEVENLAFTYYDASGATVNTMSPYASLRDIATVEIGLSARSEDAMSADGDAPLVSRVTRASLRNLN